MSLKDDFGIAAGNISQRKLRSWLTILGIVIGVAAIIALVSTSRSLESSVQEQFEAFGTDKVNVFPASGGGGPGFDGSLSEKDLDAVRKVSDYDFVTGMLFKSAKVEFGDESANVIGTGIDSSQSVQAFRELNFGFREGRPFESDSDRVVIGPRIADQLYEEKIFVGNKVKIRDRKFEVAGITESLGNPQDDSNFYMPLEVMRELFEDGETVSYILARVKPGSNISEAAEKTEDALKKIRSEESFSVVTPDQLLDQLGTIIAVLQGVLVGVAAISIIVGSVGIANSMYTSVLERVGDIGIMKSVGATNLEITRIFLIEAGMVGFIGGLIGSASGLGIAKLIELGAGLAGFSILRIRIEPGLLLFGLLFAVAVAAVSGYLPARKAAGLKPVDALRK